MPSRCPSSWGANPLAVGQQGPELSPGQVWRRPLQAGFGSLQVPEAAHLQPRDARPVLECRARPSVELPNGPLFEHSYVLEAGLLAAQP